MVRRGIRTLAEWQAIPAVERDAMLAQDMRRQRSLNELREAISENKYGPLDAAWFVLVALEQL
jgi:hypothetical protein